MRPTDPAPHSDSRQAEITHHGAALRDDVARAIYAVTCRWIAPNFPKGHKLQTFDELSSQERELNLQYADAALAAGSAFFALPDGRAVSFGGRWHGWLWRPGPDGGLVSVQQLGTMTAEQAYGPLAALLTPAAAKPETR